MLYDVYQAQLDLMAPVRAGAEAMRTLLAGASRASGTCFSSWLDWPAYFRHASASFEIVSRASLNHARPPFGIRSVLVGTEVVEVHEVVAASTPFASLLHFAKPAVADQPRVLIVAPLSGHFATLLRETVRTMLVDHDVYVTDWHNARDIALDDGPFGVEDYTDHLIEFLTVIGPGAHLVAVCQPCVAALAATAVLAESRSPFTPRSLTLMAGPIDARIAPTAVNRLATSTPIEWFRDNVVATVPRRYRGAGRRVYPGFVQLGAFLAMNTNRHLDSHWQMYRDLASGRDEEADSTKKFYDEYFSVLDLTAEFYLETVERVFQRHELARRSMTHRGRLVDPRAIVHTALVTVEGERDDICAPGQTMAAHDLAPSIRSHRRAHHLQAGVGHYGVFSGRRWENEIYPLVRATIAANN